MSRGHHVQKALNKAASRDRKRQPRMKVTGKGVFALVQLLRTKKR